MAKILEGKVIADMILREASEKITVTESNPKLALLKVGFKGDENPWEKTLTKTGSEWGIETELFTFPWDIAKEEFLVNLKEICARDDIHAVLPFLPFPLPDYMSWENEIRDIIPPDKDINCVSPVSAGKLQFNDFRGFIPAAAEGVMAVLKQQGVNIAGQKVAIISSLSEVEKSLSLLLLAENAIVTLLPPRADTFAEVLKCSDIIIVAAGEPSYFIGEYVTSGQMVIDLGLHRNENSYCGYVDMASVESAAAYLLTSPGGMELIIPAVLLSHVLKAYKNLG